MRHVSGAASYDVERYLRALSFRLVDPRHRRGRGQRIALERPGRSPAVLLELFGAPFDAVNTELPEGLGGRLRPLLDVPRMSTVAIAGLLNRAVASMPDGHSFVNVGVWQGFTLLAAMAGNPDKACIGIDNFSQFRGPRELFMERFLARRGPAHEFHDMDYREYFARAHDGPIGVYLYDGEHSYDNQMHGLEAAEEFLADGCLLIVDDTNGADPRQATMDFVASRRDYHVVADVWTGALSHPTFWNGLLVIRKGAAGEPLAVPPVDARQESGPPLPSFDRRRGAVSLVVLHPEGDSAQLSRAVAAGEGQTWRNVEVVVADATNGSHRALADALARTSGDLVAFVDSSMELRADAVELSVAYPDIAPFWSPADAAGMRRAQQGIQAAADVDKVVPDDGPYVLVADRFGMPTTSAAGSATRLEALGGRLWDLADDAALGAIDRAHADGATHLVVMWNRFGWLDRRPQLAAALTARGTTLLANDLVRVFRLGPPAPA